MHPAHLIDDEDHAIRDVWMAYQSGGFSHGYLPFAGGYAEQPSALMIALELMSSTAAKLRRKPGDSGGG